MRIEPWSSKPAAMLITALAVLFVAFPGFSLNQPPAATSTAKNGPIQITLRLYKTTVERERSLWYQIELKNVGKEKIKVTDKIFRDPWAMHENIFRRAGIYLDVTAPPGRYLDAHWPPHKADGKSPQLRRGAGTVRYEYAEKSGVSPADGKAANEKLDRLEAKWKKEGLSETQKTVARHDFWSAWNEELMRKEDEANVFWLKPGASTTTLAWSYRDLDPYAVHSGKDANVQDEEKQIGGYAQLWSYLLFYTGKHKIRAVYDYGVGDEERALDKKYGGGASPWRLEVRTPEIEFEVVK